MPILASSDTGRSATPRIGAVAATAQAITALATLAVATVWIGLAALADGQRVVQLALVNPTPLIVQDALKLVSVVTGTVLIVVFRHLLQTSASRLPAAASGFGLAAMACLLINALTSLWLVTGRGAVDGSTVRDLHLAIGLLGLAVVVLHGLWYLLTHLSALRQRALPSGLARLGIVMGGLSLLPPLGIVVLALSVWWSLWLARVLSAGPPADGADIR